LVEAIVSWLTSRTPAAKAEGSSCIRTATLSPHWPH
jgi:hypothetical protein